MDANLIIGIVVVVGVYGALLMVLRLIAEGTQRFRVRLFANGEAALDDPHVSEREKLVIEEMLRLSELPEAGWRIVHAYAQAAFGRRRPAGDIPPSKRLIRLTLDFSAAALGANPAALAVCVPLILVFAVRSHMAVRRAAQAGAASHVPQAICNA